MMDCIEEANVPLHFLLVLWDGDGEELRLQHKLEENCGGQDMPVHNERG